MKIRSTYLYICVRSFGSPCISNDGIIVAFVDLSSSISILIKYFDRHCVYIGSVVCIARHYSIIYTRVHLPATVKRPQTPFHLRPQYHHQKKKKFKYNHKTIDASFPPCTTGTIIFSLLYHCSRDDYERSAQ